MFLLSPDFWFNEISLGNVSFSPASLVLGIGLLAVLILAQRWLQRFVRVRLLPRFGFDKGLSYAYSVLCGYLFLAFGIALILPLTIRGFNWATLSVILGAISFGIGFGLRNIADNFVSGLIILLERPIKVGDRISVGDMAGNVVSIRSRSTSVRTNDNIDIIVPNSQFISQQVVNWSHGNRMVRFRIPVGVHYNSDVEEVSKALVEAGLQSENVLKEPAPSAKFLEFGDSSLNFELWVWTDSMSDRPKAFFSEINFLIWYSLKKYGIEIPYPQRDLYLKEMPLTILRSKGSGESPMD